jgi:hypothetical protein
MHQEYKGSERERGIDSGAQVHARTDGCMHAGTDATSGVADLVASAEREVDDAVEPELRDTLESAQLHRSEVRNGVSQDRGDEKK